MKIRYYSCLFCFVFVYFVLFWSYIRVPGLCMSAIALCLYFHSTLPVCLTPLIRRIISTSSRAPTLRINQFLWITFVNCMGQLLSFFQVDIDIFIFIFIWGGSYMYCMVMWASNLTKPDKERRFLWPVVDEELSLSVTRFNSIGFLKLKF